ncbi:BZ3500_MvSof-1268-A1-R1_Chr2-1g04366 [Microbotryum saponariae]|uniref:Elongator complex protein 2 n=1 Tax=Microbotryum saponariae TaxID=289078 RepID=A0A2X0M2K6_9BASI|nr:BZ3500_MvSof-1268-A1-R1_Chr2-1g04366 [Microbotryum saponariae]SCZ91560.1 BZ3501_MvSof-1269-A2-R1_Chr2-1g04022 [Microbotryum saponariae]
MATARSVYISAAANRADVADCRAPDGLLAFGSAHLVALCESNSPTAHGIHKTLAGHEGNLTALRFSKTPSSNPTPSRHLVTGDSLGQVRLWKQHSKTQQWSTRAVLSGHVKSISAVATVALGDGSNGDHFLVFTASSDASIRVWRIRTDAEPELVQKIDTKGKIPLSLETSFLPASSSQSQGVFPPSSRLLLTNPVCFFPGVALAVGSTDKRLAIYASPTASSIKVGHPNQFLLITARAHISPFQFTKSLSLEGHSDWIRCLSFITPIPADAPSSSTSTSLNYDIASSEVLLASGSQDNYIRLWRFSPAPVRTDSMTGLTSGLEALDALDQSTSSAEGELRLKSHQFIVGDPSSPSCESFACASEAVLLGHDAWVTGLRWSPLVDPKDGLRLLSASADRSMILWTPTPVVATSVPDEDTSQSSTLKGASSSSIWTSSRRFGEFSSATNLGFFGALWGFNARTVLANGWGGSWHAWRRKEAEEGEAESWDPIVATTGHFGEVRCAEWEPEGEYLMSAGHDMATRLHGPWRRKGPHGAQIETWHELARPQIHGYPLSSIAFLDRLSFVSGADEKIVRVFSAPGNLVKSLNQLSQIEFVQDGEDRPMAANVPPLGLSNRAIGKSDAEEEQIPKEAEGGLYTTAFSNASLTVPDHPPYEEHLLGSTLWPEIEKLYGHGYELLSIAARRSEGRSSSSQLIATSCKATVEQHAVVRLFEPKLGKMVGPKDGLKGHSLSITKVVFGGEGGKWLLSVSRDRSWRVFKRTEDEDLYRPHKAGVKAHARIIWDACFSPDAETFFTASRDKSVKVWSTSTWHEIETIKFEEAATAVACTRNGGKDVLAVGLENGEIRVFVKPIERVEGWKEVVVLGPEIAHVQTVTSLSFCPKKMEDALTVRLASGSEDRSVRIIDVSIWT